MGKKLKIKNRSLVEAVVFLTVLLLCCWALGSRMGSENLLRTIMNTAHDLLLNTVFFLMGITVQKAVAREQKPAADLMKFSQTMRLLMQLAVAVLGFALPCFNGYAVILSLFFPRIAIMLRPFLDKKKQ